MIGIKAMAEKKKKKDFDPARMGRTADIVATVFAVYMLVIYACWMHNKYFDITGTRADVFLEGTGFFVIIFAMAYFFEYSLAQYYEMRLPLIYRDTGLVLQPAVWMGLFLLANVAAFLMAPDKKAAWTGSEGRRFGLFMVCMLFLMVLALTRGVRLPGWIIYVAALMAILAAVMAVIQHFGVDIFYLRRDIKVKQQQKFISFFGNLNTYASYLAMVIPFFWSLFVFTNKKCRRILAGVTLFVLAAGILPSKSDNIYICLFVTGILLLFLALRKGRILEWTAVICILSAGLYLMAVLTVKYNGSKKHLNGMAEKLENGKLLLLAFLFFAFLFAGLFLLRRMKPAVYEKLSGKGVSLILAAVLAAGFLGVIIILRKSGSDLVKFNDKWGTFRGYIWRRSVSLFKAGSPLQKIFGHGNETVRRLMNDAYYEEMTRITKQTYDNCHNELLQYLVTTGLFGMISYIGFFITSVLFILKKGFAIWHKPAGEKLVKTKEEKNGQADETAAEERSETETAVAAVALGMAAVGYFAQGLVNLNQPITTPYYFFAAALGVGLIRKISK